MDTFDSVSGTLDTFIWVMDTFVQKLWQNMEFFGPIYGHLDTLWTLLKMDLSTHIVLFRVISCHFVVMDIWTLFFLFNAKKKIKKYI